MRSVLQNLPSGCSIEEPSISTIMKVKWEKFLELVAWARAVVIEKRRWIKELFEGHHS